MRRWIVYAGCSLITLTPMLSLCAEEIERLHRGEIQLVHDAGQTVDATRYYRKLEKKAAEVKAAFNNQGPINVPKPNLDKPMSMRDMLPITSSTMRPGRPIQIAVAHIYRPFFIIGIDSQSIAWMRQNYKALADRKAYGVVVQARDWQTWRQVKREALQNGITLDLLPGDALAEMYQISTYPVLVVGD